MSPQALPPQVAPSVLVVDGDVISRHAIADYLRHCGYAVIEAANTDEALVALGASSLSIDVVLCDVAAIGTRSGFELATWVRQNRPALEVRMAGSIDRWRMRQRTFARQVRTLPDHMTRKRSSITSSGCERHESGLQPRAEAPKSGMQQPETLPRRHTDKYGVAHQTCN
jgi:CheY-like chemotaxis protein